MSRLISVNIKTSVGIMRMEGKKVSQFVSLYYLFKFHKNQNSEKVKTQKLNMSSRRLREQMAWLLCLLHSQHINH